MQLDLDAIGLNQDIDTSRNIHADDQPCNNDNRPPICDWPEVYIDSIHNEEQNPIICIFNFKHKQWMLMPKE